MMDAELYEIPKHLPPKQLFIIDKTLQNQKIIDHNGYLWSIYHDSQLTEYVIKHNFDFFEIANSFQNLCNNSRKYEYSEEAVRLHWSFLHSMRLLGKPVDSNYYKEMKLKYDNKLKEITPKSIQVEKVKTLSEEEEMRKMNEELEKVKKEEEEKEKQQEKLFQFSAPKKKEDTIQKKKENIKEVEEIKVSNKKETIIQPKQTKIEIKPDENEPEYIKNLFNRKIPADIAEKLERDKEKYKNFSSNTEMKGKNIHDKGDSDENLFPIKSFLAKRNEDESYTIPSNNDIENELKNTKNMDDFIAENPELKKSYERLNNYCNFAVKSLNYIVGKKVGIGDENSLDSKIITKTNQRLNELLLGPIVEKTQEEGFNLEEFNKKIEEEEKILDSELTNYDAYMKTAPKDEDQEIKLNKFKEHLFSKAQQMTTDELLEKITHIINTTKKEEIMNAINDNNNNPQQDQQTRVMQENLLQQILQNNEDNNNNPIDELKTENTKSQTEMIENNSVSNLNNTILSDVESIEPKKYKRIYRGIAYYTDKPNEIKKKNKRQEINEYEEDEDDDDDYNK